MRTTKNKPNNTIIAERILNTPSMKDISIRTTGRPPIYKSTDDISNLADKYILQCKEDNIPLTMSGLALSLGMDRVTLTNYERRYPEDSAFFSAIKKYRSIIETSLEQKLVSGMPATGLIFALKNNSGWRDERSLDITSNGKGAFDKDSIRLASKEILMELEPSEPTSEDDND